MAVSQGSQPVKQIVAVPFAAGVDQKTDPKQMAPGKLQSLSNGVFSQTGLVSRRWGYTSLATSYVTGTSGAPAVLAGASLASTNNELLLSDGLISSSYVADHAAWVQRGIMIPATQTNTQVIANNYQQLSPDHATLGGYSLYAWEDSRGGIRYSVFDAASGAAVVTDGVVAASPAARPKTLVLSANSLIGIFYDDAAGNLRLITFSPAAPLTLTTQTVVIAGVSTPCYFDACVSPSGIACLHYYKTAAVTETVASTINAGLTGTTATSVIYSYSAVSAQTGHIGVTSDASNNFWLFTVDNTTFLASVTIKSSALAAVLATTSLGGTTKLCVAIAGIVIGTTCTIFVDSVLSASPTIRNLFSATCTLAGVVTAPIQFALGVGLASKPVSVQIQGNTSTFVVMVNVAYQSNQQSTYYTLAFVSLSANTTSPFTVVAKTEYGLGGGVLSSSDYMVPECQLNATSTAFTYANLLKGTPNTESGVILTLLGVNSTTVDVTQPKTLPSANINGETYFTGGVLHRYDGAHVFEAGFFNYPEPVNVVGSGAGGLMLAGTYFYVATYEYTDANGTNEISSPSSPVSVTTTGTTSSATVTVPYLSLTNKPTGIRLVIYRTTVSGSILYRVTSAIVPSYNSPAGGALSFVDTLADTSITSNGALYTQPLSVGTDPVLPNFAVPACKIAATYAQRLWIAGVDDPYTIFYSQTSILGSPVQFCAALNLRVDPDGGPITAMIRQDGYLVIFKAYSIFTETCQGPTATGDLSDVQAPVQVPTGGIGCSQPKAMVATPLGILFQATDEQIYLLDRNLNCTWKGAPMQTLAASVTITSAVLIPDQWVVFTTSSGTAIVYDYFYDQWATFSNHAAVDACIAYGLAGAPYVWLDGAGVVHQRAPSLSTDAGAPIPFSLVTGWLNPTTLQGYQRVYHLFVLGQYVSPHTLTVSVSYDYDSTDPALSAAIAVTASTGLPTYQYRLDLLRKCQALQVAIADGGTSTTGAGFSLSALGLVVGIKSGGNKLPALKQFGVQ